MADASPEPFGKRLHDARSARGMTLSDVSASTKISVAKLQAIERDDIDSLPGGIFTRGFVRSYAEAVGLDSRGTLTEFEARFPEESSVATLHATVRGRANEEFVWRQRAARSVVWLVLLLAALLVLLLLGVVVPGDTEPPASEGGVAGSEPPPPQSWQEPAPPPPVVPALRLDPAATEAVDSGRLTMEMSATADCWLRASADGDVVVLRLFRAGERQVLVAQEEIDLRVGDAGAFAFTINDRPGRSLGESGEVVEIRVTESNYLSFVAD